MRPDARPVPTRQPTKSPPKSPQRIGTDDLLKYMEKSEVSVVSPQYGTELDTLSQDNCEDTE